MDSRYKLAALAVIVLASLAAYGQFDQQNRSILKRAAVEYLFPEQVTLPAGTASEVDLHFRIAPGLHINSHNPKDEFLIPTALTIPEDSGVRLEQASYPPGADFTLPADPATHLNVYTGEFVIHALLRSAPGDHLVEARLRYQACDQNACMPPKTIAVPIDVIGKRSEGK